MNIYSIRSERKDAAATLLKNEMDLLLNQGYNPISNSCSAPDNSENHPRTPFIKALWLAFEKIKGVKGTLTDIKCVIRGTEKAATSLKYHNIPICDISRKHIKLILEQCLKSNPRFSAHRYNKYRYYLIRLFKELIELEAATHNVPGDISKMKVTQKIHQTLTGEERKKVSDQLFKYNRQFWKFMHLFFHSGGRETELMLLQGKDVNIKLHKYKSITKRVRTIGRTTGPLKILPCLFGLSRWLIVEMLSGVIADTDNIKKRILIS
ncbi:MAG: hypothetical protein ABI416_02385 [Ginsengibacter sp.]